MPTASRTRETTSSTAKGDGRREAILVTLGGLLPARRFGAITIADITEQAGITRPAFAEWRRNAALFAAVLDTATTDPGTAQL